MKYLVLNFSGSDKCFKGNHKKLLLSLMVVVGINDIKLWYKYFSDPNSM